MKFLQKITVGLVLMAGTCTQGVAQSAVEKSPEERARMLTQLMSEELGLTDDQVPRIDSINLAYSQRMEDIFTQATRPRERFKAAQALMKQKDTELAEVFTEKQYKAYLKRKNERRKTMRKKRGKHIGER